MRVYNEEIEGYYYYPYQFDLTPDGEAVPCGWGNGGYAENDECTLQYEFGIKDDGGYMKAYWLSETGRRIEPEEFFDDLVDDNGLELYIHDLESQIEELK